GLTKAWQLLAEGHSSAGRYEVMREPLERAIVHAQRAGDTLEEAEARATLLTVHRWGPTPVPEVIRLAEAVLPGPAGDLRLRAFALYIIAHMQGMSGDIEAARVALVAGDEIMLDLGLDFALMESAVAHQIVAMLGGDLPEAESLLRRIYDPDDPRTL